MTTTGATPHSIIRARELYKLTKATLISMHVHHGGQLGAATYRQWRKDELITAVLEDEGLDPWA